MNNLFQKSIVFYVFILTQLQCISNAPNRPIVSTKLGQIVGTVKTLDDGKRSVNLYNGIRYAKAPIGDLRFRRPVPQTKWKGVYEAIKMKYSCPQTIGMIPDEAPINEDCLFLSVWQPTQPLTAHKRSVMVFIHGGSFDSGTQFSIVYDSRWLAALGDVIVVTINYRLGPFGFLYAGTDDVSGNAGLYDQIMAINWVKDNIDAFGGDPESITIFGESAGSMSVGALVVSPLTKGLFKRAIMESGSPDSLIGSDPKAIQLVKFNHFSENLKCNESVVSKRIACLRQKSVSEILAVSSKGILSLEVFNPTFGDQLIPTKPLDALKAGKYDKNMELLFGTVKDEGSLFVEKVFMDLSPERHFNLTVSKTKQYIQLMFTILKKSYSKSIADFYTNGLKDNQTTQLLHAISDSLGDYVLTCPSILFGSQFAKSHTSNRAYAYRLTHKPTISAFSSCKGWMGVCHADDIVLLFGFPISLRGIAFTEKDYQLSKDMIHVWTTFAKTGTPPALNGTQWPEAIDRKVSNPSVKYMELNPNNYRIVENAYKPNCEGFWKNYLS